MRTSQSSESLAPRDWAKNYVMPADMEKPLASARPGGEVNNSNSPSPSQAGIMKEMEEREALHRDQIDQKYKSINTFDKANKIKALKNIHLNPYRLNNAYDGLSNSMERWKTVAKDASSGKYSPAQKEAIAKNYYNQMIAPFYGKLNINPMSEGEWAKKAYGQALEYNIENAYNSSITHGLLHGWDAGTAALARAGGFVTDVLGAGFHTMLEPNQAWHEKIQNEGSSTKKGWMDQWHESAQKVPFLNTLDSAAHKVDSRMKFSADSYPNRDWAGVATSFISEQAAQLPIWATLGAAGKVTNLTKTLVTTKLGQFVYGSLMAGGEGLAYGTLTRPQEDKGQAWRDAVGFAVFHGLFNIGGMGLKKLVDIMPEGEKLDILKRKQDALELASKGQRLATGEERYTAHKKEVANNLSVVGIPGQRAIHLDALNLIHNEETHNWTSEDMESFSKDMLSKDPARWSPVLSARAFIKKVLGNTKLSDIKEGSPEEHNLSAQLAKLIVDAGSELNQHVDAFKENTAGQAAKSAGEPSAKDALDVYRAKVLKQVADAGATKMVKPEQIEAAARKMFQEDTEKAAILAEKKLNENPEQAVANIQKKLAKKPSAIIDLPKNPATKIRSSYKEDKFGQPSASYSVNPDYKIYLQRHAKEQGMSINSKSFSTYLSKFYDGMDDEDFNTDLQTHFYPKALKEAGVFFEHSNTIEGKQNPNFQAFMYNYLDQMPKELGQELEKRLAGSLKAQKYMSGRSPSEPQLMYYAKAIYNHVDNLLGSGRWPKESNIFRSSQPNLWNPSKWQRQLLIEKGIEETKALKGAFGSNKGALKNALAAYKVFATSRLHEFDTAAKKLSSQENIQNLDTEISNILTSIGDRERIPF